MPQSFLYGILLQSWLVTVTKSQLLDYKKCGSQLSAARLKFTVVGVFTPWMLANVANDIFYPPIFLTL